MTQSRQAWLVHFVGDPTEKEVRQQINKSKCGKQRGGRSMAQAFPNHKRNEMHGNGAVACHPRGHGNDQQPETAVFMAWPAVASMLVCLLSKSFVDAPLSGFSCGSSPSGKRPMLSGERRT